jgi:pyridoxamine 5'-phosphate oxidase
VPSLAQTLSRSNLDPDPMRQLARWRADAAAAFDPLLDAVALATATPDGHPSARFVLLKEAPGGRLAFFTDYESRKGAELSANPRAALLFYWHTLGRQVRIEGRVTTASPEESDGYFDTRPSGARLSAAASRQGEVVADRAELESRVATLRERFPDGDPPRPSHWGGYVLEADAYEFWQHRDDRLHDRFRYRLADGSWIVERLAP